MPYRFLDDIAIADMAFEVEAKSLPHLFIDAAEALLSAQVDNPTAVESKETVRVEVADTQLDMLLYRFLQELVYYKDVKRWLLRAHEVLIKESSGEFHLTAQMKGEALDPARHEQRADVKAITLHRLNVQQTGDGWTATVVIDV